ncbi:Phosphodiesterase yfcE [uncultured Ruminococcus sp.]|nr:Phosphodiesterase yfcE [uncultured Ruminococcus sp.]SCH81897.1 Phosphodiesterase yfcE [uncultured Clostridium sp.]
MKWMIASDIHGSAYYCKQMVEAYRREKADRLLLLGDLLYHGPRNDLPRDYAPKQVIAMLNELSNDILCVRGNCDTEVDQMVLDFPLLADYAILCVQGRLIFATHGHRYNEADLPKIKHGDILLNGHTHVPACDQHEHYTYLNPGSVSIPKEGSPNSYLTLEDGAFLWKTLEGTVWKEFTIAP